jgi:hypothetical protein
MPSLRDHTDAVIARLEELDLLVGDAKKPEGAGDQDDGSFVKYAVVYPIAGGTSSGTLGDLHGDAELIYQVTCVGKSREQAQWVADAALGLLDGLSVPERHIPFIALDIPPGIERDDKQTPPLFIAAPRFRIITTPGEPES